MHTFTVKNMTFTHHVVSNSFRKLMLFLTLKEMSIAYDIALCLYEGQITEAEIAEALEYENNGEGKGQGQLAKSKGDMTEAEISEAIEYQNAILEHESQMTETQIGEAIEYEIAFREHEYNMYLDHMENVYGRNWRELEGQSERNFRKSLGLEEEG